MNNVSSIARKNKVKGKCLCGLTSFQLGISNIRAYQCHCSLCRMQSGTSSNLGTIIPAEKFVWLSGTEHIKYWNKDTGFTSGFCNNCGSPVPNELRGTMCYWVPVGALEGEFQVEIIAHICTDSKAVWDAITDGPVQYAGVPDISEFIADLNA